MNKKILISLSVIGLVAGITLGTTGAWWTDTATSSNTSFHSGTFALQLANVGGSSWEDDVVEQTWDYQNMIPGGDSMGDSLRLRNNGSTPADWLKFTASTAPSVDDMDKVMRITKLAYAEENLLTGGAGADLSSYEAPATADCDVIVNSGVTDRDTVHEGVVLAGDGQTVCVTPGTYTSNWETNHGGSGYPITVSTQGITIVGVNSPAGEDAAVISPAASDIQAFLVEADGVTIKGLNIDGNGTTFTGYQLAGIQVSPISGHQIIKDITIRDNVITNLNTINNGASSKGIQLYSNEGNNWGFQNITIANNDISNISASTNGAYGIQTVGRFNPVAIMHNTTRDINGQWEAGIAIDSNEQVYTRASITLNDLQSETVGLQVECKVRGDFLTIEHNNLESLFYGGECGVYDGERKLVATNNWWGDFDPSDQVSGNVNWDSYAGGPFIGFINGNDRNGNGFADLNDFYGVTNPNYDNDPIVINDPQLKINGENEQSFDLEVQLDGPTSNNTYQDENVELDVTATMSQGPNPTE